MDKKKLLLLLILVVVIIGIAFALFYFLGERAEQNGDIDPNNPFPINTDSGFGSFPGEDTGEEIETPTPPIVEDGVTIIPTLRKLSDEPTSGVFVYDTLREVETVVYNEEGEETIEIVEIPETKFQIIERRNAHITEFNSLDLLFEKISNTSIARVREAIIGSNGYVFRYVAEYSETIISFLASFQEVITIVEGEDGEREEIITRVLTGEFLPENITSMTLSPNKTSVAYIVPTETGATLYTTPLSSFAPILITSLPISEVEILWSDANTFLLYTKPDSRVAGHLFTVTASGQLQTVLNDLYGLTVLPSRTGEQVFISFTSRGDIVSGAVNISDGTASNISGVRTVAGDKCVWSTVEEYTLFCAGTRASIRGDLPEDWYTGSLFFADVLWKINSQTGQSEIISYLDEGGVATPFDLTHLTLSANDAYLLFINKYDRAPWVLDLKAISSQEN